MLAAQSLLLAKQPPRKARQSATHNLDAIADAKAADPNQQADAQHNGIDDWGREPTDAC